MGVYVFRSKHAPFVKVGHYKGCDAWGRVARRGFRSCVCPAQIRGRVGCDDLELLGWFPSLSPRHEKAAHRILRAAGHGAAGEWFHASAAVVALGHLSTLCADEAAGCSLERACAAPARRRKAEPRERGSKRAGRSMAKARASAGVSASAAPGGGRATVLSFDVGIRHLAYCVVQLGGGAPPHISEWDVVDVTGPGKHSIDELTDRLMDALDERFFRPGDPGYDAVLVENQPANKNPQMKSVQMIIYSYFHMLRRYGAGAREVRLVSARRKLASAAPGAANTYASRKAQSVDACRAFLEQHGMAERQRQLASSGKKDDLSDCLLQALAWWEGGGARLLGTATS